MVVPRLDFRAILGPFFDQKDDEQIDAEIDAEKVMEINENQCNNGPKIDLKFDIFRKLVS